MAADVRVKLSAEGTAEVVAAFQKVRAESLAASKQSTSGFQGFNQVLGASRQLLGALGIAASVGLAVAELRNMAVEGAENAAQLVNQAQAAGATQQEYSALAAGARLTGVDMQQLGTAFSQFDSNLDGLRRGLPAAAEKFQVLKLSVADFHGKDTAQAIALVAQRISEMENGSAKTTALRDLLGGKVGARMVAFLNTLGRDGLEPTIENFKKLGIVLDDQVVGAAARMGDQLGILQLQSKSLATQFAAGLSPSVDALFQVLSKDLGESGDTWQLFGRVVGVVLAGLVGTVTLIVDSVVSLIEVTGRGVVTIAKFATDTVTLQWDKARTDAEKGVADIESMIKKYVDRQKNLFVGVGNAALNTANFNLQPDAARAQSVFGTADDANARVKQQLAASVTLAQGEAKSIALANKLIQDADQSRYDRGLISLEQYYATRRQVIESNLRAELKALAARAAQERNQPDTPTRAANLGNIQREIQDRKAEASAQTKTLNNDEAVVRQHLAEQQLNYENQILGAQGKRHQAEMKDVDEEASKYAVLLAQQGVAFDNIFLEVNRFRQAMDAPINFNAKIDDFSQSMDDLDRKRKAVQDDVSLGLISEREGRKRILAIEQESLANLRAQADAALVAAKATGPADSPGVRAAVAKAQDLVDSLRNLGVATTDWQKQMANFGDSAASVISDDLGNALDDSTQKFRTFGDVVVGTIATILQSLRQLAAQLIATGLKSLISPIKVGGKVPGLGSQPSLAGLGLATGGWVRGPGTATSDSVPVMASHGEFMVKASVAQRSVVGRALEWMNHRATPKQLDELGKLIMSGALDPVEIRPLEQILSGHGSEAPSSGGGVKAEIAGGITIELDEGLIAKRIDSGKLDDALVRFVQRNPRAVGRLARPGRR